MENRIFKLDDISEGSKNENFSLRQSPYSQSILQN